VIRKHYLSISLAIVIGLASGSAKGNERVEHAFSIGQNDFLLDGKPLQIRCGELHFTRVPREYWRHRLRMCKAMGLNTVCAYLFWNFHERTPGQFYWEDRADAAEFCRLAQQEGLWVILRPGPYSCSEWEMGGLPWWLLKNNDIQLRSRDPAFLDAARNYLKEVGRVLGPLQVTEGGPILMVQAENEYGFFGKDAAYMQEIHQALLDANFEVPLFSCNPVQHLRDGHCEDLFPVVNFGSNPEQGFEALRKILPHGPLMCGEYYSGWFDTWGNPHHTGDTQRYLKDLQYMLQHGASFSIYMAHGGTSFGLWAGADRPFKPDTSCYDYDAPISEAGWVTEKFNRTRELMSRHLLPGEELPEPPPSNPVITLPEIAFTRRADLFENTAHAIKDDSPGAFEKYDIARGCLLYRTTVPVGPAAKLKVEAIHDAAWIHVNGKEVGVMDRRMRLFEVSLPARDSVSQLDILVEAMGRINFGTEMHDRKGIRGPVRLQTSDGALVQLQQWEIFAFPMTLPMLKELAFNEVGRDTIDGPAFWQSTFHVDTPGDTFLDMSTWGKGVVWVNGHCLGRYWNIGPTQSMYLPGVWLTEGQNQIVVLDLLGPTDPIVSGLEEPILDRLRPELDFAGSGRANRTLNLEGTEPVHKGEFSPGQQAQLVEFSRAASGRYFCLESLNAHDAQAYAAVAELDLIDTDGNVLSHEDWTIAFVDSEEKAREDGTAENAIDGQTANHWHTAWSNSQPWHPHRLVVDLGKTRAIKALRYVPRSGGPGVGGRIKGYRVYLGDQIITD
jgi:beta-galactosidase